MKNIILILLGLIAMLNFNSCKNDNVLETILSENKTLNSVVKNKDKYDLQILFTQVDKGNNGKISFKTP